MVFSIIISIKYKYYVQCDSNKKQILNNDLYEFYFLYFVLFLLLKFHINDLSLVLVSFAKVFSIHF